MSRKPVSHTFDTLPPLTEKQRRHLEALAAQPDDTVNGGAISGHAAE